MRKNHIIVLLAVIFLFISGCSYSRNLGVLERQQAIEDIDFLVEHYEKIHYDPYGNIDRGDFNDYVEKVKEGFNEQVSRKDLSVSIMELLALFGDDHTNLDSYIDFMYYLKSGGGILPLNLVYRDGVFIVDNTVDTNDTDGNSKDIRLIEVNGRAVEDYVEEYRSLVSSQSDYFKDNIIAVRFGMYFWYLEGRQKSFRIALAESTGEKFVRQIDAVGIPREKCVEKKPAAEDMFMYRFLYEGRICLFRASSFNALNKDMIPNGWIHKKLIKIINKLIADMKKNKSELLIVDLRSNGGGDDKYGVELLKRTAGKSFKLSEEHVRNSRAARKALIINWLTENWLASRCIPAFLHLENIYDFRLYKMKKKHYAIDGEYWHRKEEIVEPLADHWDGQIVLLVDGLTGSAAVELTSIVKDNELGLIAGKETGGGANFYGGVVPVILPNSGLVCNISNILIVRPGGFDGGRGVLPDIELDVTLDDEVLVEKIYHSVMMGSVN